MSIDFDQLTGQNANHKSILKIYDDKDFLTSFNKLECDTENIENILTSRPFRTFLQTKLDDLNLKEKDQTNNDQAQIIIDEREKVSDVITKLDKLTEEFMCVNKTVEIEPLLERLMASDPKYQQGENSSVMNYFKENYLLGVLSLSTNILNKKLTKYISNCFENSSPEELDTYQMYLNPKHNTLVNALLETISKRYNELVSSNPSLFIKIISKITGQAKKNKNLIEEYEKIHGKLLDKKEQYANLNSPDASTIKASEINSYNELVTEEKERMNMGAEDRKGKASPQEKGFFFGLFDFLLKIFGVKKTSPQKKTVSIKEAPHLMDLDVDKSCKGINLADESKKDVADLAQASMQTLNNHAKEDKPDLSDPLFYLNEDSKIVIYDKLKKWVESILGDEEAPEFTAYEKKVITALKDKKPIEHSKRSTVRQCVNDLNEFNLHQPKPLKSESLDTAPPQAAKTKPQEDGASDKVNKPLKSILKK